MKIILTTLFTVAVFNSSVTANDLQTTNNKSAAKQKTIVVKAPFKNHWDSNSWEAGSENYY